MYRVFPSQSRRHWIVKWKSVDDRTMRNRNNMIMNNPNTLSCLKKRYRLRGKHERSSAHHLRLLVWGAVSPSSPQRHSYQRRVAAPLRASYQTAPQRHSYQRRVAAPQRASYQTAPHQRRVAAPLRTRVPLAQGVLR